jgi:hypothetical protein
MEGNQIAVVVVVAVFHMFVVLVLSVELLFVQQGGFVLHTNVTQKPVVFFFEMSLEEADGVEARLVFAVFEPAAHCIEIIEFFLDIRMSV